MKEDFEIFKQEISWFIKASDKVELNNFELNLTDNFKSTFPTLYQLVSQANVISVNITRKKQVFNYVLLTWTDKNKLKASWLLNLNHEKSKINIINEHQLLVENIGGIEESYFQQETDEEILSLNQNFLFIKSNCTIGLGGWDEYYSEMCNDENKQEIDFKEFICFVEEANGNLTLYDPKSKDVLLFASDHCFDNVELLENQPELTFYKINGITNFIDYVETLAKQWIKIIT
jgi:hypothetical protein